MSELLNRTHHDTVIISHKPYNTIVYDVKEINSVILSLQPVETVVDDDLRFNAVLASLNDYHGTMVANNNIIAQLIDATSIHDIPIYTADSDNNVVGQTVVGTFFLDKPLYTIDANNNVVTQIISGTSTSAIPYYTANADNNVIGQALVIEGTVEPPYYTVDASNNVIAQNIEVSGAVDTAFYYATSDNNVIAQNVQASGVVDTAYYTATSSINVIGQNVDATGIGDPVDYIATADINVIGQTVNGSIDYTPGEAFATADINVIGQTIDSTVLFDNIEFIMAASNNVIAQTVDASGQAFIEQRFMNADINVVGQSVDATALFDNILFTMTADNNVIGQTIDSDGVANVPEYIATSDNNVIAQTVDATGLFDNSVVTMVADINVISQTIDSAVTVDNPVYTATASNNVIGQTVDAVAVFDNIEFIMNADNNVIGQSATATGTSEIPSYTATASNNVIGQTIESTGEMEQQECFTMTRDANAITTNPNATNNNAQYKDSGFALNIPSSGGYLRTTSTTTDFNVGTGDFTVEAWVYHQGAIGGSFIIGGTSSGSGDGRYSVMAVLVDGANINFGMYGGVGAGWLKHTAQFPSGEWVHVAAERKNGNVTVYQNGVGHSIGASNLSIGGSRYMTIGAFEDGGVNSFEGWIDLFRYSNVVRYDGNFTPSVYDHDDVNTRFFLNPDGPQGSTTFVDSNEYEDCYWSSELWSPVNMTTYRWYDASDNATLVLDGSNKVEEILDKKDNTKKAVQTNSALRPVLGTINGKQALDWDTPSVNGAMIDTFGETVTQPTFIIGVVLYGQDGAYFTDGITSSNRHATYAAGSPIKQNLHAGGTVSSSVTLDPAIVNMPECLFNGNSNGSSVRLNGSSPTFGSGGTQSLTGLTIGNRFNVALANRSSKVGELIVINGIPTTNERKRLEGYLAHKWGIASLLPSNHEYKDKPPLVAEWTAAEVTRGAHYDASDAASVTIDGSTNVEQWNDISGNNRHVTQVSASVRPAYDSTNDYVHFDGTEYLFNNSPFMYANGDIHVFAVMDASPVSDDRWISEDSSSNNNPIYAPTQSQSTGFGNADDGTVFIRNDTGSALLTQGGITSTGQYATGDAIIYSKDSGSSITLGRNGVLDSAVAYTRSGSMAVDQFVLGGILRAGFCCGLDANIKEIVIVTQDMTTEEREKMEGYLAHKWGLTASLPANHPYKTDPPMV